MVDLRHRHTVNRQPVPSAGILQMLGRFRHVSHLEVAGRASVTGWEDGQALANGLAALLRDGWMPTTLRIRGQELRTRGVETICHALAEAMARASAGPTTASPRSARRKTPLELLDLGFNVAGDGGAAEVAKLLEVSSNGLGPAAVCLSGCMGALMARHHSRQVMSQRVPVDRVSS